MEIIAELHPQHGGDRDVIKKMIHQAKANGADVAKFQLYNAFKLFSSHDWDYLEFDKRGVHQLVSWCEEEGIEFMASVFDEERLKWCEEFGVRRYKIASRTVKEDMVLCNAILNTGKEAIVSLGMWNEKEKPFKANSKVKYLYCVSKYPASLEDMKGFPGDFKKEGFAGYSDHTVGIDMCLLAVARGAGIIEKHFTFDKTRIRNTEKAHPCSMLPEELNMLSDTGRKIYRDYCAIFKNNGAK